jgi:hypothetical protein
MSNIYDTIDWPLLAKQKARLLEVAAGDKLLPGLVSLLDAIQDEASDEGYPVVFLQEGEE